MADGYPRADRNLRYAPDEGVSAAAPQSVVEIYYVCSACGSPWSYADVRNTGRCPSCGGGLRRPADS